MGEAAIELQGVTKVFGTRIAVRDLDVCIHTGALSGFVGPNGSGKTTTLRMILRILLPSSGRLRVLGSETARAVDDRTGYLPEERGLYQRMRIGEVLRFFARLKGVTRPARAVDRWLERLDLQGRSGERVETLSKGLARKVQFAAAVVHDPQLLVLDEPFSGLDPVSTEDLRNAILELRRGGTTVLLSTHDMSAAEHMCDGVVMLHRGAKVLDGAIDEIKAQRGVETLRIRFSGSPDSLRTLPGVTALHDYGQEQSLELAPGQNPQAVLRELLERGKLTKFELARPSLREIFVQIAREDADG